MGGPTRFEAFASLSSWALPAAVHYRGGAHATNKALSIQLLCCCFIVSWGKDFAKKEARS